MVFHEQTYGLVAGESRATGTISAGSEQGQTENEDRAERLVDVRPPIVQVIVVAVYPGSGIHGVATQIA
jgi:hypothetical protein